MFFYDWQHTLSRAFVEPLHKWDARTLILFELIWLCALLMAYKKKKSSYQLKDITQITIYILPTLSMEEQHRDCYILTQTL